MSTSAGRSAAALLRFSRSLKMEPSCGALKGQDAGAYERGGGGGRAEGHRWGEGCACQSGPGPPHPTRWIIGFCLSVLSCCRVQTSLKGVDLPGLIRVSIQTALTQSQKREKNYKYCNFFMWYLLYCVYCIDTMWGFYAVVSDVSESLLRSLWRDFILTSRVRIQKQTE